MFCDTQVASMVILTNEADKSAKSSWVRMSLASSLAKA
ncbi:hypothetical protein BHECKSOX2_300 [Bathymodiolus heckerae thiotrophic gill symbiont]|nr:hypothetical protein BHECKSOX2_300 [Bathymodiolus heckerae thiotrophic gill symbiont]SMN16557.1 hypothetical protein CRYPD_1107 [uncultured Candidatus Thioglobus sp.]